MKEEYVKRLEAIKIKVSDPLASSKLHQELKCILCGSTWVATPKSKIRNYKLYGAEGCPICSEDARYKKARDENIEYLQIKFIIMDDLSTIIFKNTTMLNVTNRTCGHLFISKIGNLLNRAVNCPVCNDERKRQNFIDHHNKRVEESRKYKDAFQIYKAKAYALTQQTYKKCKNIINPLNLPRQRAEEGKIGYQLDHIVPIKQCFFFKVPEELCAHVDNLQMLPWHDNISKHATYTNNIPVILQEYFTNV